MCKSGFRAQCLGKSQVSVNLKVNENRVCNILAIAEIKKTQVHEEKKNQNKTEVDAIETEARDNKQYPTTPQPT